MGMTVDEALQRIEHDPDFIYAKRFDYSLSKLLERYPDGAPPRVIAQALLTTEEDVESQYQKIIHKLRRRMKVDVS